MICISVTPTSRRLAAADLYNAARLGDLVELCLDGLKKTPDVGALLKAVDKPVLVSCRRREDGGKWTGSEDERIQLLRNAIVAGPDWVELELDTAQRIPRFGKTRRVVSCTSLNRPLRQDAIERVIEDCCAAQADVVKFTWKTDTLDDAWPLLAAATQNRQVPVVGKGIGPSGLTFSLLARRYGAPWIYAALERGMETFEGEATAGQLNEEYGWCDIDRRTRFVGIPGRDDVENTSARILNAAFREYSVPVRCLPLIPGRPGRLRRMLDVLKIRALLLGSACQDAVRHLIDDVHRTVRDDGWFDMLTEKDGRWKARASLFEAIHAAGTKERGDERWVQGRTVLVIGTSPLSVSLAGRFSGMNAAVSLAAPSDNAAAQAARKVGVRHIPWSAIHGAVVDTVILADGTVRCGPVRSELNPSLLRERMTVIDLMKYPAESAMAEEARARGCHYISPALVFAFQLQTQFRFLTGRSIPLDAFQKGLLC